MSIISFKKNEISMAAILCKACAIVNTLEHFDEACTQAFAWYGLQN